MISTIWQANLKATDDFIAFCLVVSEIEFRVAGKTDSWINDALGVASLLAILQTPRFQNV
jgi:hypothetical protein